MESVVFARTIRVHDVSYCMGLADDTLTKTPITSDEVVMSEPGHLCIACNHCDGAFVMSVVGDDHQLTGTLVTCHYCGQPIRPPNGTIAENKPNEPEVRSPRDLKYHKSDAFHFSSHLVWAETRSAELY